MILQDVLQRWVSNKLASVAQLAEWMDCGPDVVYKYLNDERPVPFDRVRRAALQMSRRYGDNGVAELLLSPEFEVARRPEAVADGRIEDEIHDGVLAYARASTGHANRDRAEMDRAIADAEAVIDRLKAERDRLG